MNKKTSYNFLNILIYIILILILICLFFLSSKSKNLESRIEILESKKSYGMQNFMGYAFVCDGNGNLMQIVNETGGGVKGEIIKYKNN